MVGIFRIWADADTSLISWIIPHHHHHLHKILNRNQGSAVLLWRPGAVKIKLGTCQMLREVNNYKSFFVLFFFSLRNLKVDQMNLEETLKTSCLLNLSWSSFTSSQGALAVSRMVSRASKDHGVYRCTEKPEPHIRSCPRPLTRSKPLTRSSLSSPAHLQARRFRVRQAFSVRFCEIVQQFNMVHIGSVPVLNL